MTVNEFKTVIDIGAMESVGFADGTEFVVCQNGPFMFANQPAVDSQYMAFLPDEDTPEPVFCDTVDDILDKFVINGRTLREQLENITAFSPCSCID